MKEIRDLKLVKKFFVFRNEGFLSDVRCFFCKVLSFCEFKNIYKVYGFEIG